MFSGYLQTEDTTYSMIYPMLSTRICPNASRVHSRSAGHTKTPPIQASCSATTLVSWAFRSAPAMSLPSKPAATEICRNMCRTSTNHVFLGRWLVARRWPYTLIKRLITYSFFLASVFISELGHICPTRRKRCLRRAWGEYSLEQSSIHTSGSFPV